jgi:cytochrome c oxidase assembly protein subunit 11
VIRKRNRLTLYGLLGVLGIMLGLTAYSETLYRMFCAATGYGGTTRTATGTSGQVLDRMVTVRFNADVATDLPWTFKPMQREIKMRVGERGLAFFTATNNSNRAVTGQATFNVTPEKTGQYFNKIQCFCFTKQVLKSGQSANLGVAFFVDPAIATDPLTKDVTAVTLSYTFFPAKSESKSVAQVTR